MLDISVPKRFVQSRHCLCVCVFLCVSFSLWCFFSWPSLTLRLCGDWLTLFSFKMVYTLLCAGLGASAWAFLVTWRRKCKVPVPPSMHHCSGEACFCLRFICSTTHHMVTLCASLDPLQLGVALSRCSTDEKNAGVRVSAQKISQQDAHHTLHHWLGVLPSHDSAP